MNKNFGERRASSAVNGFLLFFTARWPLEDREMHAEEASLKQNIHF